MSNPMSAWDGCVREKTTLHTSFNNHPGMQFLEYSVTVVGYPPAFLKFHKSQAVLTDREVGV